MSYVNGGRETAVDYFIVSNSILMIYGNGMGPTAVVAEQKHPP